MNTLILVNHEFTDKQTEKIIKGLFSDSISYDEFILEMLDKYLNSDLLNKKEWVDWFDKVV